METKEQKNKTRTREKKPLTEQQRQQRKKMLVYPLMVLLFAGCMWLIFAPSSEDKEKERQVMVLLFAGCMWLIFAPSSEDKEKERQGQGFNTDMPLPEDSKIIGDKAKAYEQHDLENKRKERRGMVGDLSAFWNDGKKDDSNTVSDDYRLTRTETPEDKPGDETRTNIRTSAAAYQRLNTSLGTFYEPPKEDTEKEELRERIDELEAMLVAQESKPSTMEEQVALLEKSYELAAKYQNGNNAGQSAQPKEIEASVSARNGKAVAEPVSGVRRTVVSALPQPMTDSAFIADYSGERNYGFHTAIGAEETTGKNTIAACVQGDQTLTDGQTVKLRLLEPMRVSGRIVPRNTPLVGAARLQGERLGIRITSLEHDGSIIPVESASPRWNMMGASSRWNWRCTTATGRRASSSPARWR